MAIGLIANGEAGLSVRTKINQAFDQLNSLTTSTEFIDSEQDLLEAAPLNGSNQHVLAANTAYVFGTSFTHDNPLLWQHTSTECYGNGIGQTKITYSGTSSQHIVANGSFRSRGMQWIAPNVTGSQVQFGGTGSGTGTNVSLDTTYLICPLGCALDVTDCDFFYCNGAVIIAAEPVLFKGTNCGILSSNQSLLRTTTVGNVLDLGSSVFVEVLASATLLEGVSSSVAFAGLANNGNIGKSATISNCIIDDSLTTFSGITQDDVKYEFQGNRGVPNSSTVCFAYIDPEATTTITQGSFVQLGGTWNRASLSSRSLVDVGGEITFQNNETIKSSASCTVSVYKISGGGSANYEVRLEKSTNGGTIWTAVEGMTKPFSLLASNSASITWFGAVEYVAGDKFRVTIQGVDSSIDVVAESCQLVIGGN